MSTLSGGPNIIVDGLVLYLDASNTKSYIPGTTVWNDISKTQLISSLVNGPTYSSANGGSIVFDGVNDYTTQPFDPTGLLEYTIEFWAKSYITGSNTALAGNLAGGTYIRTNFLSDGTTLNVLMFVDGVTNDGFLSTALILTPERLLGYNHYAFTFKDSVNMTFYFNGALRNNNVPLSTGGFSTWYRGIGIYAGMCWNGEIANTKIYNRALSATEVGQNFNSTRSRFGI